MARRLVDIVRLQADKRGVFRIAVPKEAVKTLKLRKGQQVSVYLDEQERQMIYQPQ